METIRTTQADGREKPGRWWIGVVVVLAFLLLGMKLSLAVALYWANHGGSASWLTIPEVMAEERKTKPITTQAPSKGTASNPKTPPTADVGKQSPPPEAATANEAMVRLEQKETELRRKERELQQKQEYLSKMEADIERKLQELSSLQKEIQSFKSEKEAGQNAKVRSLSKIYENMKPKEAAKLLDNLEEPLVVNIISTMNTASAASILANMETKKAAKISQALTSR